MPYRISSLLRNALRLAIVAALPGSIVSAEWNQYRGPTDDSISKEKIATQWPADGPKVVWKIPMGEGFGSFAVAGGKAMVFAERNRMESLVSLDPMTGKELWVATIGPTTNDKSGGPCPRTTPAIDGDHVYVYSTYLKLQCLNSADGKVVWSHDLAKEFQGQNATSGIKSWGNAVSPLVDGNLVIVIGGGTGQSMMAFDKTTGAVVWKTGDEKLTHASPTLATIGGVKQVIFFTQSGLVSCDPATGKELWRHPFPFKTSTAASPVVFEDIVYCSAGYGVGAGAVRVSKSSTGFKVDEIWRTPNDNISHWTTPVCKDGYLYGMIGFKEHFKEPLKCIDIRTGKVMWSQPGFGQGGLCMVGDALVVQGEGGQIVLAEPSPTAYHELARVQPIGKKCWNMAVVSDGKLYTRSSTEAICLEVGMK